MSPASALRLSLLRLFCSLLLIGELLPPIASTGGRTNSMVPTSALRGTRSLRSLRTPVPTGSEPVQGTHPTARSQHTEPGRAGARPEGDGSAVVYVRALAGVGVGLHGEAAVTLEVEHIGRGVHGPPLAASAEEGAHPAPLCAAQAGGRDGGPRDRPENQPAQHEQRKQQPGPEVYQRWCRCRCGGSTTRAPREPVGGPARLTRSAGMVRSTVSTLAA